MARSGKVVKVEKVGSIKPLRQAHDLDILDELCFNYPAYTLAAARKLSWPHVKRMVRNARKFRAQHYWNLTQITAAPHTDKGKGVDILLARYENEMNE